jgi:hypothetical protein
MGERTTGTNPTLSAIIKSITYELKRILDACDNVKVEWKNETGLGVWTGEDLQQADRRRDQAMPREACRDDREDQGHQKAADEGLRVASRRGHRGTGGVFGESKEEVGLACREGGSCSSRD